MAAAMARAAPAQYQVRRKALPVRAAGADAAEAAVAAAIASRRAEMASQAPAGAGS